MNQLDEVFARLEEAGKSIEAYTQEQVDQMVRSVVDAGVRENRRLAELAVSETGYGRVADKMVKNELATTILWDSIKDEKTVGIIREDPNRNIWEVAAPVGIVAAVIPSTNPTSTTLYKAIIALKGRNPVLFSPHPSAKGCIGETVKVIQNALKQVGAPSDAVQILENPTIELTNEMMRHPKTGVILATGGLGLVKAAYSSGKPAYGVGPGNVPVFVERSAEVEKAAKDVVAGKSFDNGTVCASEQSVIVDQPIADRMLDAFKRNGCYVVNNEEKKKLEQVVVTPKFTASPKIVGKDPAVIAGIAGFSVPEETRVLLVPMDGVGKEHPLSIEKLSPILCFYVADGWQAACERCIQLLSFGGLGHSLGIHSRNLDVIREFALKKPAFRILVNTPTTHGAVGYTTRLMPSMTLGCGTFGNNITSENITAKHMINVKHIAFETNPVNPGAESPLQVGGSSGLADIIDRKLQGRVVAETPHDVVDFVSERDVMDAVRDGRKILISSRTMITPLAKDTAREHDVLRKVD